MEIALVENLQRKDLTAFEESEALHVLATRCGYTHEMLARRLGKSRTSVTESLSLQAMPDEVKNLCRLADISSKSLLLQVVRQSDPQKMTALVEKIAAGGGATTREAVRKVIAKPKPGRPKAFTFNYRPQHKNFSLKLRFRKGTVEHDEVITALEGHPGRTEAPGVGRLTAFAQRSTTGACRRARRHRAPTESQGARGGPAVGANTGTPTIPGAITSERVWARVPFKSEEEPSLTPPCASLRAFQTRSARMAVQRAPRGRRDSQAAKGSSGISRAETWLVLSPARAALRAGVFLPGDVLYST